jgi:hypothetical protein
MWDVVVVDVGDGRLLDEGLVEERVSLSDECTVRLKKVGGRGDIVFAVALVDGDGGPEP